MKHKLIFFVLLLFLLQTHLCYGLDWKRLHEEADKLTIREAFLATKNKPDFVDDLYILGLVYLNFHLDRKAEATFRKVLDLSPQTFEAKWGIAEVLRRQHNLEESEKLLNEVKKTEPSFSPAYISLSYIKYTQLDFHQSVDLAYYVIKQRKDKVDLSNYTRAYLLLAGGKGMLAHYGGPLSKVINGTSVLLNLKKAQALQPDAAAVLFGLGSFYFLAPPIIGGNRDKAKEYLEKTIKADPLFADAYVRLAQIYKMNGDEPRYEELMRRALEIDPQNDLALDAKSKKCKFICVSLEE